MYKRYFLNAFGQFFFSLFTVLFFVSSVILLITIAGSSHVVKLNFVDLMFLFLYSLPNTVFFIIPITFFTSCVLAISRLSYDYEMLVFFSLGVKPFALVKTFLPLTLIVTLTSLVFSLGAVPISKRAFENFIEQKKVDVDINIRAGEFGQKIGDWLVYVESAKDRIYQNLVLFSSKGFGFENFINADQGSVSNKGGIFSLALKNGESYMAQDNEFRKVVFEEMNIRTQVGEAPLSGYDLIEYWRDAFNGESQSKQKRFAKAILVSIFPLLSIFLIPLIGIANPRYHKNFSSFYVLISIVLFYAGAHIFVEQKAFLALAVIPPVWFVLTYILYARKIKPLY